MISKNLFTIAEIGINHNGDINIAKKLIDNSKEAGFNAVKFQKRTIDLVYSQKDLEKFQKALGELLRDSKRGIRICEKNYDEIHDYCKKKILFGLHQLGI